MKNGIYGVTFGGLGRVTSSGVCYVENGRLRGGDSGRAFYGEYSVTGTAVTAVLEFLRLRSGCLSVFGDALDRFKIVINGVVDGDRCGVVLATSARSGLAVSMCWRWVAELPR